MATKHNARVALGDLLINNWAPSNAEGYDPTLSESDDKHLDVHLGAHDESKDYPQLALASVAGQAMDRFLEGTGDGITLRHRGRVDAHVYTGATHHLPEHPQKLAETIGWEAYRIVHANRQGVSDPETGALMLTKVEPIAEPLVRVDQDFDPPQYSALVQLGYDRHRQPP